MDEHKSKTSRYSGDLRAHQEYNFFLLSLEINISRDTGISKMNIQIISLRAN